MSNELSEVFLEKMKPLIRDGNRYFVMRNRSGISYIQQLASLGLTSIDEAWEIVLLLDKSNYIKGPEVDHNDTSGRLVIWVFKMYVNDKLTYIKLKDEEEKRGCVCLSFHKDESSN